MSQIKSNFKNKKTKRFLCELQYRIISLFADYFQSTLMLLYF